MKLRSGKFGIFLGCTRYPECNGIVNIPRKGELIQEDLPGCPATDCPGKLVAKRSRFGKVFYACSTYPDCNVIGNSVDEVLEKYSNHPRTKAEPRKAVKKKGEKPEKKVAGAKKAKVPQPGYHVTKELEAIIGVATCSRPEITKKVWEYIKEHHLQDTKNKRLIKPDAKLEKVFGQKEAIDMMQLARYLSAHIKGKA